MKNLKRSNLLRQAYASPVKNKLKGLTGKEITLYSYEEPYQLVVIEPALFYIAYGLPNEFDPDTLTAYFNKRYIKGTPLNEIGLKLII